MLEKPEFEITEKAGLAGKKCIIWGKEGYSADDFLENNGENIMVSSRKTQKQKTK